MSGKELFEKYTSKRDHSGSESDSYAATLSNILFTCSNFDLFGALERAEKKSLKIKVNYPKEVIDGTILTNEIQSSWISIG